MSNIVENAKEAKELTTLAKGVHTLLEELDSRLKAAADNGRFSEVVNLGSPCLLTLPSMPVGQLVGVELLKAAEATASFPKMHLHAMVALRNLGFDVRATVSKARWADPLEFAPEIASWVVCWQKVLPSSQSSSFAKYSSAEVLHQRTLASKVVKESLAQVLAAVTDSAQQGLAEVTIYFGFTRHVSLVVCEKLQERGFQAKLVQYEGGRLGISVGWQAA